MIVEVLGKTPVIGNNCKVFDTAFVSGDVKLGKDVSVWPGAAVRGDESSITVGSGTNIQDCAVLHTSKNKPLQVGENVTVGHGAILHSCTVGNSVVVGMGSIILDGAQIGDGATVGAGTLIPPGKIVPEGMLAVGNPYKVIRQITHAEAKTNHDNMLGYKKLIKEYE